MAYIFMSDLKDKHMKKLKELRIKKRHRLVDDIFAILKTKEEKNIILNFKNTFHL